MRSPAHALTLPDERSIRKHVGASPVGMGPDYVGGTETLERGSERATMSTCPDHLPTTPDGRYFVHRGILWRCSNPRLDEEERQRLVNVLMEARRQVGAALRSGDTERERTARARVHETKVALGERGPTWWDGPDYNRMKPENTPYSAWWATFKAGGQP